MDYHRKRQQPLIYDSSHISRIRAISYRMFEMLAWAIWLFLWLPIFVSIFHFFGSRLTEMDGWMLGLLGSMKLSVFLLIAATTLFIIWKSLRMRYSVFPAMQDHAPDTRFPPDFDPDEELQSRWQESQIMVAQHFEETGGLSHITMLR